MFLLSGVAAAAATIWIARFINPSSLSAVSADRRLLPGIRCHVGEPTRPMACIMRGHRVCPVRSGYRSRRRDPAQRCPVGRDSLDLSSTHQSVCDGCLDRQHGPYLTASSLFSATADESTAAGCGDDPSAPPGSPPSAGNCVCPSSAAPMNRLPSGPNSRVQ